MTGKFRKTYTDSVAVNLASLCGYGVRTNVLDDGAVSFTAIEPDGTVVREWNHAEARVMCGFHRVVKVLPGRKKVAK